MIDTHAHLYLPEFGSDIDEVVIRAKEKAQAVILPNIDWASLADLNALVEKYSGYMFATIGLHPCSVEENFNKVLLQMENELARNSDHYVGIGETGLDLYWDKSNLASQLEALERQIEWAVAYQKPIILHTRQAFTETLNVIQKRSNPRLKGIFHCFNGSAQEARAVQELNFWVGIGGTITYKKNALRQAIMDIPLEAIVLETDAPYLAPVPYRGKRNESGYLCYIASEVAQLKGVSFEEVVEITSKNAKVVFGL
jgi:TatD DNase family protein